MPVGYRRMMVARIGAALGFGCGTLGLLAGLMDRTWILGYFGWFLGGSLLTLVALFALVDGAIASQKTKH
jgi:hypothetical protein